MINTASTIIFIFNAYTDATHENREQILATFPVLNGGRAATSASGLTVKVRKSRVVDATKQDWS